MFKEFKEFALKGNVLDMAVGIIIGAAFTGVVNSLVKDILTPPLGLLSPNKATFDSFKIPLSEKDAINVGTFANNFIQFLLVAFAVFLLVKAVNRFRRTEPAPAPAAPTTKECPYCLSEIPLKATRCGHCTSELRA